MWGMLKTNAIAALTISALALGAAAPANAMNDQTRNLIKGAAAVLIIGTLLSNMGDDSPAPQTRYAPPPQPQPHAQPPRTHHRHDVRPETRPMAPPPRPAMTAHNSGRVIGGRFEPLPQPRAPQAGYDGRLRDYADRNGGERQGYDVPRLDQPPRQYPMR